MNDGAQFLTEAELKQAHDLVRHINREMVPHMKLLPDPIRLIDANGELAGTIEQVTGQQYGLVFP